MKKLLTILGLTLPFFAIAVNPAHAASSDVTQYTSNTLGMITLIATASAVFFLVKGGYQYITSSGKPDNLENAKKTIRNALIGLVIVLGASLFVSILTNAFTSSTGTTTTSAINIAPITSVKPNDGLTQVLIDAVSSFLQNIVESATKPIVDGIMTFLTTTPTLLDNSVILKFWFVILGIVDSLFVVVVALLGLHFMSASTLGFDEVDLKQLLPRIGLAFLGANVSLFLADYTIVTCNTLVKAILDSTGGLNHAWIVNAITLQNVVGNNVPIITLIFLLLFLIIAIVLLLMYISRLIMISLFAVLSPFVFLLWIIPRFSDFAEIAVKSYVVTVFIVFVHVVVIQLAASFLTLPENTNNSILSVAIAIGLFFTLLKTPSLMMQMIMYTTGNNAVRKLGGQIINVISTDGSGVANTASKGAVKTPRRVVRA